MSATVTDEIRRAPPGLHGAGTDYFGLGWPALEWLEGHLHAEMTTLETGCGGSTIVFAASGADHTAITPAGEEHARVRDYCDARGISTSRVTFIAEGSHVALAADGGRELDLALLDGAHGFPYPVLDWFYVAPRLKVGGALIVDDAFLPSINTLVRYLRLSGSWRFECALGYRTVWFTKLDAEPPGFDALGTRFDAFAQFNYLPPGRRLIAMARHGLLDRLLVKYRPVLSRSAPRSRG